jgi:hypothetical protein
MTDEIPTRFKLKLGAAEIEYEGNPEFLKNEIMPTVEKILGMVESRADLQRTGAAPMGVQPKLSKLTDEGDFNQLSSISALTEDSQNTIKQTTSLASYLKTKEALSNQTQRFLATAAWLYQRGQKEVTSPIVAKTLQEHQQAKLANAADCLNKNLKKGLCEKTKSGFFITPEGWDHLGGAQ